MKKLTSVFIWGLCFSICGRFETSELFCIAKVLGFFFLAMAVLGSTWVGFKMKIASRNEWSDKKLSLEGFQYCHLCRLNPGTKSGKIAGLDLSYVSLALWEAFNYSKYYYHFCFKYSIQPSLVLSTVINDSSKCMLIHQLWQGEYLLDVRDVIPHMWKPAPTFSYYLHQSVAPNRANNPTAYITLQTAHYTSDVFPDKWHHFNHWASCWTLRIIGTSHTVSATSFPIHIHIMQFPWGRPSSKEKKKPVVNARSSLLLTTQSKRLDKHQLIYGFIFFQWLFVPCP